MKKLNLKPTHKPIRDYYEALEEYEQHNITHEGAVSNPFAFLLATCAKRVGVTLEPQHAMHSPKGNCIVIDGAIIDSYRLPIAYWEAKDMDDDLYKIKEDKDTKKHKGSYIVKNPNREEDLRYIVDLIARVITVKYQSFKDKGRDMKESEVHTLI